MKIYLCNKYLCYFLAELAITAMTSAATLGNTFYTERLENDNSKWISLNGNTLTYARRPDSDTKALKLCKKDKVASPYIDLPPAARYALKFNSWSEKRGMFQILIQEFNKNGKLLTVSDMYRLTEQLWKAGEPRKCLLPIEIPFDTAPDGGRIRIIIKKNGDNNCWFDDITIKSVSERELLESDPECESINGCFNSDSLMLPGPDGVLYPNWTRAGIRQWKNASKIFNIVDFGGLPDDGKDDSDAFENAVKAAEEANGGSIVLGPGTYHLSRKILIRKDKIIIKGSGEKKTKVILKLPDSNIYISTPTVGAKIIPRVQATIYFPGENAQKVTIFIEDKEIINWNNPALFKTVDVDKKFKTVHFQGKEIIDVCGTGYKKLHVKVTYNDGTELDAYQPFLLENSWFYSWDTNAYISFDGIRNRDTKRRQHLSRDMKRGDREIFLEDTSEFNKGSYIIVNAPQTERWNKLSLNSCSWGNFRMFATRITEVKDKSVVVDQPSRIAMPLADAPYVESFTPISFCAVEDISFEQQGIIQKVLKTGTIQFRNAVNCRASNVSVIKSGFRPLYGRYVKNCSFINCTFIDAWNQHGSLAYAGFDYGWDCLIEGMETFRMRHGPTLNWTSSGNVIRNSIFHESDAQLHSGWCCDNLFEQCRIESTTYKYRGYGYGFYASPYNDSGHGPGGGPRNVIYNCDSVSLLSAVFMGGGGNHNWLIMYNKFKADSGPGIIQRLGCKNTRIEGNVFVLKDTKAPLIYYEFLDCTGDIIIGNNIYGGNGKLFQGASKPGQEQNNHFMPYTKNIPESTPPVQSIYKWQIKKYSSKSN